ncbi:hypothetical protein GP421_RS13345, partial [Enterococcus hirae]
MIKKISMKKILVIVCFMIISILPITQGFAEENQNNFGGFSIEGIPN